MIMNMIPTRTLTTIAISVLSVTAGTVELEGHGPFIWKEQGMLHFEPNFEGLRIKVTERIGETKIRVEIVQKKTAIHIESLSRVWQQGNDL